MRGRRRDPRPFQTPSSRTCVNDGGWALDERSIATRRERRDLLRRAAKTASCWSTLTTSRRHKRGPSVALSDRRLRENSRYRSCGSEDFSEATIQGLHEGYRVKRARSSDFQRRRREMGSERRSGSKPHPIPQLLRSQGLTQERASALRPPPTAAPRRSAVHRRSPAHHRTMSDALCRTAA